MKKPKYLAKVDIRITPELKRALTLVATDRQISRGELVRMALENLFKTEKAPVA